MPFRFVLAAAVALVCGACASTGGATKPRFYTAQPFGSESEFNPLTQIVNEGFNNLALQTTDLSLGSQPFARSLQNLQHSVANAQRAYHEYGWDRARRNELLPLTAHEGGQWVPNYQDHFLGSGMVSARLVEWFDQHHVPFPVAMSFATMTASHILNEVVERPNPLSVDAITDLLVFDNLGFLAFRFNAMQRLVSDHVTFTSWAWQPMVTLPTYSLENAGQSFVLKFPLPRTTAWRGFYFWGITHIFGVSRDLGEGRALSFGAGAGSINVAVSDSSTDTRTVALGYRAGVFYDRNNSLLASVLWENSRGTLATVNVYPGLFTIGGHSPGFWFAFRERGGHRFGLSMPLGLGVGYGRGQVR